MFVVRRVVPSLRVTTYKVKELDNTPLQGAFYTRDFPKVTVDESSFFRVEKVLKGNKDKLYVKWKGYPAKYNRWIHKRCYYLYMCCYHERRYIETIRGVHATSSPCPPKGR